MVLDLLARVQALIEKGLDIRKAWSTILFHTADSPINASFKHKYYGFLKRKDGDIRFHQHVTNAPVRWFRTKHNGVGPRDRAIKRERNIREKLIGWEQWGTHASLIMAHDIATFRSNKEGGAKDFCLVSPWQMLNTFTQSEDKQNAKTRKSISYQKQLMQPADTAFEEEWLDNGQPLSEWPCCSLYNSRCDADVTIAEDKREYFLTLDIDGKHACSTEEVQNKACNDVIRLFEQSSNGNTARLCVIGDAVKEAFRDYGLDVSVSWHKTLGWKPSWRGYVVGAIFQNPGQAKQFVSERVIPKLPLEENPWLVDGVFDLSSYNTGVDRCIGSAKLTVKRPDDMRFLDTSPMESVSDAYLMSVFFKCPNEYLLTVMGWIYPDFLRWNEPHLRFVQGFNEPIVAAKLHKRKREHTRTATSSSVCAEDGALIQQMVEESLESAGFVCGWQGAGAERGVDLNGIDYVEIRASGTNCFCVHNECEDKNSSGWNIPVRKPNAMPHTTAAKIKFRLSLLPEKLCPDKRYWLKQNCFSGKCDNRFRRVCPVTGDTVRQLRLPKSVQFNAIAPPPHENTYELNDFIMDLKIVGDDAVVMHLN